MTRAYPVPGNYTVLVEVRDCSGQTSIGTVDVTMTEFVIPEIGTLLVPMSGMMSILLALFAVKRRRR